MPAHELSGTTALVTGASRGFGRDIAVALSKHGAHVAADVADPVVAGQLLDQHRRRTLVLNAGAAPLTRPIHRQISGRVAQALQVDQATRPGGGSMSWRRWTRCPRSVGP
jgi:NAD(P)-dependent dehydrogenase (short-subunit alcohol dehydrogenase family)